MRVATEGVVYISSDGNYSTLIQADGGSRILTVQLGQLEALISKQLVRDGKYVKESSRWKYSSRRRALCLKDGQCFIVETLEVETFPRFSYVLEDLDVDAAVYLVGGESYGYGRDCDGEKIEFGISVQAALLAVVAKEKPGRCGYPCRPGRFLYCRLRKSAEGL